VTRGFYVAAAVLDGLGFVLTWFEVRERLRTRRAYAVAVREAQPWLEWNEHPGVVSSLRTLKGDDAESIDWRRGLNELAALLKAAERRLAGLSGDTSDLRLWLGLGLLACGIACGAVGNIGGS
jgi:hypothetical protein